MLKTNQKNLILGGLVALVLVMGIAFSVFSTNLNIEGTSNISNKWDIKITNIEAKKENIVGHAKDDEENPASYEDLTATFSALLYYPNDSIAYDITLKNNGTLDATLSNIEKNIETNSDKIDVEFSGFTKGQVLRKNTEEVLHVKVTYKNDVALAENNNNINPLNNNENITPTLLDTEEDNKPQSTIRIKFTFMQEGESGTEPSTKYLVSYDCTTNGGTSCLDYDEYVYSDVDLSHEGNKNGYTFVGWNTDSNATIGLSELSISNNTTLYAIYKKTLTLTYTKGDNVSSIGKENDTCDIYNNNTVTCTKELTSITPNEGYTSLGWYKDNEKVGEENISYTFTEDTTLISKTIQNNPLVITGKSNLKYTGSEQELIEVTTNGINDIYYSTSELTKDNYTTGSTTIPTGTNADTYTIYYFSLGNDNYGDAKGSIEVTIEKADPVITLSATSGITSSGGGKATFTEKANVAGSFGNTSSSTGVATVSPATYSSIAANTAKTVTLTGGSTVKSTSTITVTFTPTDINYNTTTKTYTVRNEKVPTITDNGGGSFTISYNGICNTTGVTCKYSTNGGSSFTSLSGTNKTNSSYTGTLSEDSTVVGRIDYGSNFISASKLIELPKTAATTISKLNATVVTSGDGLYADSYESGRYTYRGSNTNNYFTFNGETAGWRIVSIESDGTIKIVKTESLGNKEWDATNTRASGTDTYCTQASNYGCNAWAKTSALASSDSTFSSGLASGVFHQYGTNGGTSGTDYNGKVTKEASLNTYLNDDYYVNTLKSNTNIEKHDFYVSTPGHYIDTEDIATNVGQEKLYTWKGYVGLITATDYMRASTSSSCTTLKAAYESPYPCKNSNYLFTNQFYWWTISPFVNSNRSRVWLVYSGGQLLHSNASSPYGVRPAIYLKSGISIKGSGTSGSPYYIGSD